MANSTGSSSTASRNPYLLVGVGIVIGLLLSFVYSQVFRDNTKNQTAVQVPTVPPTEAVPLTNEDKILGKWEMVSDSKLLDRGMGTEFEFIKGGNLNTSRGVLQFSFPDPQHMKLTDGSASTIVNFSINDGNITLQEAGQSTIILAPLKVLDVTANDLIGVWKIVRRMGHDEPCINLKINGHEFDEETFDMIGPHSIAFDADGKVSIEGSFESKEQGTYRLDKGNLTIDATSNNPLHGPLNTICSVQKTNTKLILGSNTNSSILHLVRAKTP